MSVRYVRSSLHEHGAMLYPLTTLIEIMYHQDSSSCQSIYNFFLQRFSPLCRPYSSNFRRSRPFITRV